MDIRVEAQSINSVLEEHNEEDLIDVCTHETSVLDMVLPTTMAKEHQKDPILGIVYQYVTKGIKPKPSAIAKIASKAVRKYLLQFDQLILKITVLHHLYINSDVEYYQLVLPQIYNTAVLQMIHDDYGHHGLDHTLSLAHERCYWSTVYQEVSDYVANCPHHQIAKGYYVGPNT